MIYLDEANITIVKDILKKLLPKRTVLAFGSRVKGNIKPQSDLDLCIMGEHPLTFENLALLKEAFSESDLPIRVDIVEWINITPEFQGIIKNNCEPIVP